MLGVSVMLPALLVPTPPVRNHARSRLWTRPVGLRHKSELNRASGGRSRIGGDSCRQLLERYYFPLGLGFVDQIRETF
jgi:hypothetical protein